MSMQTHIILSNETAAWLDGQCLAARKNGAALNRSQLLRGTIAGLARSGMDLSLCRTDDDVAGLVAFFFTALRPGAGAECTVGTGPHKSLNSKRNGGL